MSKIQLYQGDCLEVVKKNPDKSTDMVLCGLSYRTTLRSRDIMLKFGKTDRKAVIDDE